MMSLLNELKFVVNKVVDSDIKRVGVNIPSVGVVSDIEGLKESDIIICLNNRFVFEIRNKYRLNRILMIRQ